MGLFDGLFGGGETTTKTEPWSGVQGPLKDLYSRTQTALDNVQGFYPGQTFANLTPLQESGLKGGLEYAQNYYMPAAQAYNNQLARYMQSPMNIAQDPAVQAQMAANATQAQDWLTRQAMPLVRQGAQANNMYGSSRQGIAEGQAIGDATKALTNANASTMTNAYGIASDLAGRAAGLSPDAMAMGFKPSELAFNAGGVYQTQEQKAIDEAMKRFSYPEQNLWDRLGLAGNIYSGSGQYGTTTQEQPSNILGTIAGLGMSAAGLGWSPFG